ncbi:hypothetical protein R5R35_011228 [Gryllus longicercus]|uniref:Uncharacterized protein n=1 Tax=Gryllus longicercus TaxID=2509291 RepID=A0AAN9V2V5_9ORTH
MSFSRAPLSRFNEKNAQKIMGRVTTPQVKDKVKQGGPSNTNANTNTNPNAVKNSSKNNLSKQRSNSSTQQNHQPSPQQRCRGRLGSQCSSLSLEGSENMWAARATSRSTSREVALNSFKNFTNLY